MRTSMVATTVRMKTMTAHRVPRMQFMPKPPQNHALPSGHIPAQAIRTTEDVAHGKPAPDLFLSAAEALGVPPERCLVYEDSDLGLEAARKAGMRWVDVRPIVEAERAVAGHDD